MCRFKLYLLLSAVSYFFFNFRNFFFYFHVTDSTPRHNRTTTVSPSEWNARTTQFWLLNESETLRRLWERSNRECCFLFDLFRRYLCSVHVELLQKQQKHQKSRKKRCQQALTILTYYYIYLNKKNQLLLLIIHLCLYKIIIQNKNVNFLNFSC